MRKLQFVLDGGTVFVDPGGGTGTIFPGPGTETFPREGDGGIENDPGF